VDDHAQTLTFFAGNVTDEMFYQLETDRYKTGCEYFRDSLYDDRYTQLEGWSVNENEI